MRELSAGEIGALKVIRKKYSEAKTQLSLTGEDLLSRAEVDCFEKEQFAAREMYYKAYSPIAELELRFENVIREIDKMLKEGEQ